ncbi:anaerobic ribonucleoside-triphosphate reductase [Aquabacterium sp.]|uniref:anaerobic ribonucleoside-triphosphate reductase n=1 Tax=Aquabacterium sp. TaxID=1872578 RepID=UPI0035B07FE9
MNTLRTSAPHPILSEQERQRCEIWTRVMGYHRPVSSFNIGKKGEFAERQYFQEPSAQAPESTC